MSHLRGQYSNATPTSSITSSDGPSTPRTSSGESVRDRRSIVRASVFDAFYQLGGFEENSQLAEWMFNDSENSSHTSSPIGPSLQFKEPQTGSRFRERVHSDSPVFVLNDWKEEEEETTVQKESNVKKNKGRAKGKAAGSMAPKRQSSIKLANGTAHRQRQAPRRGFPFFRSRTPRTAKIPESPAEDKNVEGRSSRPKNGRPVLGRAHTQPVPRPSHSHNNSVGTFADWEKVDPLSTVDFQTIASAENPFLHGSSRPPENSGPPQVPFPSARHSSPTSSSFMQRISLAVTRPFRHSLTESTRARTPSPTKSVSMFASLRRTQSNTGVDSIPRPFLFSSPSSAPPSAFHHTRQLYPTTSHS